MNYVNKRKYVSVFKPFDSEDDLCLEFMEDESRLWEGKALIMGSVLGLDFGKNFDKWEGEILGFEACISGFVGVGSRLREGVIIGNDK